MAEDAIISSLNRRIEELTGENVRRKRRERDALDRLKAAEERADALEKSAGPKTVADAQARVKEMEDALKAAAKAVEDAPSAHAEEVKRLRAELLGRDRRAAFDKAAAAKIRADALGDAFDRVQWGDDPKIDEARLGEEVDRLVAERPYLKRGPDGPESGAGGPGESVPSPRPPGPGSDRGAAPGKAPAPPRHGGRIA